MSSPAPLFTFAAISDSHLNPEGAQNTSPWRTNRLANARNERVVAELNRIKPAFVVHIGDIVHPLPSNPMFVSAADYAKRLYGRLTCPFHLLPGNHDVGDKPLDWMPADKINAGFVDKYRATFGNDWGAFTQQGCRFIRINSSLLNSGLPQEADQRRWLEAELASAASERIFFFTHYPPFIARPDEDSHYDNLDEPARGWLLALLARHKVEALFAGHVHNFFYNRFGPMQCYVLPSLTSLRQDYAEFFRIEPVEEYGRNDVAKLGFFLVDVHADGHVVRFVRSNGLTADGPPTALARRPSPTSPVGVHLRHAWADETELPYNGPLDELSRKRARNDYGLLAMLDLGVKHVRVPVSDLADERVRTRMADLHGLGFRFTVFSFGTPNAATIALMREHRGIVERWELILPRRALAAAVTALRPAPGGLPPVFLSRLREHEGAEQDAAKPFDHSISIGFSAFETETAADWLSQPDAGGSFAGAVFIVEPDEPISAACEAAARWCERARAGALVSIKLGPRGSAAAAPPMAHVRARVAEAVLCGAIFPTLRLFLDTFQEIDRGYFLRPGLVDRRCNPTPVGDGFRDLQIALAELEPHGLPRDAFRNGCREIAFATRRGARVLCLPDDKPPFFANAEGERAAG
jgi:3',5'-cyclic AMP phosphodiesterase CpdA